MYELLKDIEVFGNGIISKELLIQLWSDARNLSAGQDSAEFVYNSFDEYKKAKSLC